jgi:hypothetical protein
MKKAIQSQKKKNGASVHQKEISRILKANQGEYNCDESYAPFIKHFVKHIVTEAGVEDNTLDQKDPEDFTPDQNSDDFNNSLEDQTPQDNFDTQGTDPSVTANAIREIGEWSQKLDQFAEFMNSPTSQSLAKTLASEDRPGSLLRGITRKASDSISRIAGEIAKLKETLNGFINLAPKKQRDAEITRMS